MAIPDPPPLPRAEQRARQRRIVRLARGLGFVGRIEYRHIYTQSGGAQYGRGQSDRQDLLAVYAEAFDRDADPTDFSLEAILAHERGHQLLARHPRLARKVAPALSPASEEILASVLGAILLTNQADRDALIAKAMVELVEHGEPPGTAVRRLQELWDLMERLL